MSKNFQLLEQLDRELLRGASQHPAEEASDVPDTLKPNLGHRTYKELTQLVQGLFLNNATPARQVVFTSAGPDVGCTWICVRVTEVLCSQTTQNVCLVDTNTNSPGVSGYFNIVDSAGFSDALASDGPMSNFTQRVAKNVWVVTAGSGGEGKIARSSERVASRLFELGRDFDFVLMDAPPVAADSSSLMIANLADGAVLVLKASHTPRHAVRLALKELNNARVKVLGAVLNQRDYPIPDSIYRRL